MKKLIFCAAVILFISEGCSVSPSVNISQDKTQEVLDHHWIAFKENDLEAVMADYTEESILITPDATYEGLDAIRENFERAFIAFPKDQSVLQLSKTVVEKDVAYILWKASTPAFELTYGTDTFIIQDGKIIRQTYAGVSSPN